MVTSQMNTELLESIDFKLTMIALMGAFATGCLMGHIHYNFNGNKR